VPDAAIHAILDLRRGQGTPHEAGAPVAPAGTVLTDRAGRCRAGESCHQRDYNERQPPAATAGRLGIRLVTHLALLQLRSVWVSPPIDNLGDLRFAPVSWL
jgi:hypothetical protein